MASGALDTTAGEMPATVLILSAVAVVLLMSLALVPFAVPVADDYCRAAIDTDWLAFVAERYREWTGRWAAMALYGLVLPNVDLVSWFYLVALTLIYATCCLSWFAALRLLFGEALTKKQTALLTASAVALYWAGACRNQGRRCTG